jgi:glutamine amidotransferase
MIAIVDYGMGNLRSVQKAFEIQGFDARITSNKNLIRDASHIVLPGVGAIADAMYNLGKAGLTGALISEVKGGKPFLGICLGMQMLFEKSHEDGLHDCLGLIPGEVVPFNIDLWVPHIGWNSLEIQDNTILGNPGQETYVYFVHSYHGVCNDKEDIAAMTNYGYRFVSAVRHDNVFGVQFHPEKSGDVGLEILNKFGGINI